MTIKKHDSGQNESTIGDKKITIHVEKGLGQSKITNRDNKITIRDKKTTILDKKNTIHDKKARFVKQKAHDFVTGKPRFATKQHDW